jgi:glycosyltransferase involved in cell wall biosynthesis
MAPISQPLVSVVTPVYNGEKHLAVCIESVLHQTYSNWEYVIVNNSSTDRSLEIARSYVAKDPRIRVYDNSSFLDALANHNHALRQISDASEFCKIVFGDDWLYPECLERMVALARQHPTVGLVGAYGLFGSRVAWGGLPQEQTVVPGREFCRAKLLGKPWQFGTMTSVLIRADLVRKRKTFFNETNLHADNEACFDVLMESDFGFVHEVLSVTRIEEGTLRSISQRLNTYLSGELLLLVRFGPTCLTETELQDAVAACLREYYRFLAQSVLPLREAEFWRFHKRKLAALGYPFSYSRLARAVLARVAGLALNPRRSLAASGRLLKPAAECGRPLKAGDCR